MADRYKTISEIAAELRLAHVTVWKKVQDGTIPGYQLGGPRTAWRVDTRDYREFLSKSRRDSNTSTDESVVV